MPERTIDSESLQGGASRDADRPFEQVFISYASGDQSKAEAVAGALAGAGVPVWFDREGIEGGRIVCVGDRRGDS
jgi:TIR domain